LLGLRSRFELAGRLELVFAQRPILLLLALGAHLG